MMGKIRNLLNGNKSYLGFIALGLLGLARAGDWITEDQFQTWAVVVGSLTGVAMRAAIQKSGPNGGKGDPA